MLKSSLDTFETVIASLLLQDKSRKVRGAQDNLLISSALTMAKANGAADAIMTRGVSQIENA